MSSSISKPPSANPMMLRSTPHQLQQIHPYGNPQHKSESNMTTASDKATENHFKEEIDKLRRDIQATRDENQSIRKSIHLRDDKMVLLADISLKSAQLLQNLSDEYRDLLETSVYSVKKEFENKINTSSIPVTSNNGTLHKSTPNSSANSNINNKSDFSNFHIEVLLKDLTDFKARITKLQAKHDASYIEFKRYQDTVDQRFKSIEEDDEHNHESQLPTSQLKQYQYSRDSLDEDSPIALLNEKKTITNIHMSSNDSIIRLPSPESLRMTKSIAVGGGGTKFSNTKSISRSEVDRFVREAINALELEFEDTYIKRQAFSIEMKKQRQAIEEQISQLEGAKVNENLRQMEEKLKSMLNTVNEKMSVLQFNDRILEYSKLKEVATLASKVDLINATVVSCQSGIETLKKFLKQSDESILFKASKMDLEILDKDLKDNYAPLSLLVLESDTIKKSVTEVKEDLGGQIAKISLDNRAFVKEYIKSVVSQEIQSEVYAGLQKYEIPEIERNLDRVKDQLAVKADLIDVQNLQHEKSNKDSMEKLMSFLGIFHKQFKQSNVSCIAFMKAIVDATELETAGVRYAEMLKAIGQMESLFTAANEAQLVGASGLKDRWMQQSLQQQLGTSKYISPSKNSSHARAEVEAARSNAKAYNVNQILMSQSQNSNLRPLQLQQQSQLQQQQKKKDVVPIQLQLQQSQQVTTPGAGGGGGSSSAGEQVFMNTRSNSTQQQQSQQSASSRDGFGSTSMSSANVKRMLSAQKFRSRMMTGGKKSSSMADDIASQTAGEKGYMKRKPDDLDFSDDNEFNFNLFNQTYSFNRSQQQQSQQYQKFSRKNNYDSIEHKSKTRSYTEG